MNQEPLLVVGASFIDKLVKHFQLPAGTDIVFCQCRPGYTMIDFLYRLPGDAEAIYKYVDAREFLISNMKDKKNEEVVDTQVVDAE